MIEFSIILCMQVKETKFEQSLKVTILMKELESWRKIWRKIESENEWSYYLAVQLLYWNANYDYCLYIMYQFIAKLCYVWWLMVSIVTSVSSTCPTIVWCVFLRVHVWLHNSKWINLCFQHAKFVFNRVSLSLWIISQWLGRVDSVWIFFSLLESKVR